MEKVVILEFGYRMIGGKIFNNKMEEVKISEYESIIKSKKSKTNDWLTIEPTELKDILTNNETSYIRDDSLIIGIDHETPFIVKLIEEFDGKSKLLFKTIDPVELSYWLWKLNKHYNEKLDWIYETFEIDPAIGKQFQGFLINEFIFDGFIYRLIINKDTEYIKIKKVAKAPKTNNTDTRTQTAKNIFDELGI